MSQGTRGSDLISTRVLSTLLLFALMHSSLFLAAKAQIAEPAGGSVARPQDALVEFLPPLPVSEKHILSVLQEPTTIDFQEIALQEAVNYLKDLHGIEIQLDTKILEDSGVGADTPVTRNVKGIPLRSALNLMLPDLELTFIVQNDMLLITTRENADVVLVVRVYPVGDLADDKSYDELIEAITSTVAPTSWDDGGGPASLSPVKAAKSLVISQTQAAHDEILTLLRSLRGARAVAATPAK